MIDSFKIIEALQKQLTNSAEVIAELSIESKDIEINAYVNELPEHAPWIGLYLRRATVRPHTTGRGYLHTLNMTIVTQESSPSTPVECTKSLERLNKLVVETITKDIKLGGVVDAVQDIDILYTYVEEDRESLYFQMSKIEIVAEVRVNATR